MSSVSQKRLLRTDLNDYKKSISYLAPATALRSSPVPPAKSGQQKGNYDVFNKGLQYISMRGLRRLLTSFQDAFKTMFQEGQKETIQSSTCFSGICLSYCLLLMAFFFGVKNTAAQSLSNAPSFLRDSLSKDQQVTLSQYQRQSPLQPTGSQDDVDEKVIARCQEWAEAHGVGVNTTWGTLPVTLQAEGIEISCGKLSIQNSVAVHHHDCRNYTGGHVTE